MLRNAYLIFLIGLTVQFIVLPEINATVGLFAPDRYEGIPEACLLPMDFGYCRAKVKRYYFDMRRMKCAMFFWGGCAGNINNFKSMEECSRVCLDPYAELNGGNIYEERQNNEQKYIAVNADNSSRNNNRNKSSSKISNNSNNNNNNNTNVNNYNHNNNNNNKTANSQHNQQIPTANYVNTNAGFSSNYNNNNNNNNRDYNINNKPNKYLFNNNNLRKSFTLTKQHQDSTSNNSNNNNSDGSSAEKIYDDDYEN